MAKRKWDGSDSTDITDDANWSGAVAAGDDLIFPANAAGFNVEGTLAEEINSVVVEDGCTLTFGTNVSGVITPVVINLVNQTDHTVDLSGTGVSYFNFTNAATITVRKAGTTQTSGVNPLNIATGPVATINIIPTNSAFVGIAHQGGETAVVTGDINITGGTVFIGSGVTLTTVNINQSGGIVWNSAELDTDDILYIDGGTFYHLAGACNSIVSTGGTVYYNSTGTLLSLDLRGTIDFSKELGSREVTTAVVYEGAKLLDPHGDVTWGTNKIDFYKCGLQNTEVDIGTHFMLTKGSL